MAAAKPFRLIGHGENRLDFGARQEVYLSLVVALACGGGERAREEAQRF